MGKVKLIGDENIIAGKSIFVKRTVLFHYLGTLQYMIQTKHCVLSPILHAHMALWRGSVRAGDEDFGRGRKDAHQ